ncbi:uncharacterized protein BCR38DRAFT_467122 [Pseudomassariella vexata]|uniref:ubiquitinyl hydrolase 1 n=1 Tax=Pseudomassariella vexata TaxID=1141098 RepID=A0A1Y2DTQ2_9PEZI|nr:uncharacterized protein BCR38DRAFT_467122 [Pseudomassariella vexata]ORY62516.1 hypothetical protein BCR38DRAFT_467122 [Pseudomassariella vexata]
MEWMTDPKVLKSIFDHVALPLQLPQQQDANIQAVESALLDRLVCASCVMRDVDGGRNHQIWESIRRSLTVCKSVNIGGRLERSRLLLHLREVASSDFLILHVSMQNAGLIIRRCKDESFGDGLLFEMFEASPKREDVLAAKSALQWDFPGVAVVVPLVVFMDDLFLENLATFLEQCSTESTKPFSDVAFKAGSDVWEYRGTSDPSLITSFLTALLEANGRRVSPTLLRKRVKDDVCWSNADIPWRRLPLWLVLRVGIARFLAASLGGELGRLHYKLFVCIVHDIVLSECKDVTTLEEQSWLKAKLCRRLVKLDQDYSADSATYPLFLNKLIPQIECTIRDTSIRIDSVWNLEKQVIARQILPVPRVASDLDQRLSLRNSGEYLESACRQFQSQHINVATHRSSARRVSTSDLYLTKNGLDDFSKTFVDIFAREKELLDSLHDPDLASVSSATICKIRAAQIRNYLDLVGTNYDGDSEQKSLMILLVFELWVDLDKITCSIFPLLQEFHPLFSAGALDVLHLPQMQDMVRLQAVQEYLIYRANTCQSNHHIFADPSRGCFATRYYDEAKYLHELHQSILDEAAERCARKEDEWKQSMSEYERLGQEFNKATCIFTTDNYGQRFHNPRCSRCKLHRKMSDMKISIYEEPLPSEPALQKAIVFELACPQTFGTYRSITFSIFSRLGLSRQEQNVAPKLRLTKYSELQQFSRPSSGVSLASTTKSFLTTHYSTVALPVEWEQVCRPNGLKLGYFDEASGIWPGRIRLRPLFTHHCQPEIPKSSPFSSLLSLPNFAVDSSGPSSYEIAASRSACPDGLNSHEWFAFCTLMSGRKRRWISILTELGSSNLNFSTEASVGLLSHLAVQCGPSDGNGSPLREIHAIFQDESFCRKLLEQLDLRLKAAVSNWRETYLMEVITTMLLRIISLTSHTQSKDLQAINEMALNLLRTARAVFIRWMKMLREERQQAKDPATSANCQTYLVWACLQAKRTFVTHLLDPDTDSLSTQSASTLIECSATVQDNFPDSQAVPILLRRSVIRDLRMMFELQGQILQSLQRQPESCLLPALRELWPPSSSFQLLSVSFHEGFWVKSYFDCLEQGNIQCVEYNYLQGQLLVDGQSLGKLPTDVKSSVVLAELFGNQSLLKYPSNQPGMSYSLTVSRQGWHTHIGYDEYGMVIRAVRGQVVLQVVPRSVFLSRAGFDLPLSLINEHVHWLNLKTRTLEIRPKQTVWTTNTSNWTLELSSRRCSRRQSKTSESLVDPYSSLFCRIARILDGFEVRQHLLVYQPQNPKALTIFLKRMQLLFFVNKNNFLQSPHLRVEIDPNQDAGTWYGLTCHVVCRDISNPSQRSILVPLGKLAAQRRRHHVQISVQLQNIYETSACYFKYGINGILGRIDCSAEPILVYTKALLHAYTSFPISDPLTGRTGTEEALQILDSGMAQCWTPLSLGQVNILQTIARLTPRREYYPEKLQVMKKEFWDPVLPVTIQHDAFRVLVERILLQSEKLSKFELQPLEFPSLPEQNTHLELRAILRRYSLQRRDTCNYYPQAPLPLPYLSRDRPSTSSIRYLNVFEAASLIRKWPSQMSTVENISYNLSQAPVVSGYGQEFDKTSLTEKLKTDVRAEWGKLVNTVISHADNQYYLMFLLGSICFRFDANMGLIRSLIAFALFVELRTMELPNDLEYTNFRANQIPQMDKLLELIEPFRAPVPESEQPVLLEFASTKERRKLWQAKVSHEKKVDEDCKFFVQFLLEQWPSPEPSLSHLDRSFLLDMGAAFEAVKLNWAMLFRNHIFSRHLEKVQDIFNRRNQDSTSFRTSPFIPLEELYPTRQSSTVIPTLGDHLVRMPAWQQARQSSRSVTNSVQSIHLRVPHHDTLHNSASKDAYIQMEAVPKLERIINSFTGTKSAVRAKYASDLSLSLKAFKSRIKPAKTSVNQLKQARSSKGGIVSFVRDFEAKFNDILCAMEQPSSTINLRQIRWLKVGQLWPVLTRLTLLEQLRSTAGFGSGMKEAILSFGVSLTKLQQQKRIDELILSRDQERCEDEMNNLGHTNWDPAEIPSWLLLEIESNLMIRETQVDVARAIIAPSTGVNSVLQMNMGEGKTSCIIPMVAAMLADGKSLVRIVVPKALLQQTGQLLKSRLGGLLGKPICHVPFSRKTLTKESVIRTYQSLHRSIQRRSGVMLCLPEHNLSFMLSGLQRLLDNQVPEAAMLVKTQRWMSSCCRDILDESDFTLATKTQLIYPSGTLLNVDNHPHRWKVAETLLDLVDKNLYVLSESFPHSIEVVRRPQGGFPLIFFLRTDVEEELLNRLRIDILSGSRNIIPIETLDHKDRLAVKEFLTAAKVRPSSLERVKSLCPDRPHVPRTVFLLRGLLVHRILLMTLKKRWNVQYGLHPTRYPIAVPYHAKGVPSDSAEWGHPDVSILLTCLSFYHGGITIEQTRQALDHMLKSDDPSSEYDRWTNESFPEYLRDWHSLKVDDTHQLNQIWNSVRYNVIVIDYFLNNLVFPKHAKQFKFKLHSNGWDIPNFATSTQDLSAPNGCDNKRLKALTTGFSGTNDSRSILPLTIKQDDLDALAHTNAEVLTYLLQPRSSGCIISADSEGKRLGEVNLLRLMKGSKIKILIDAGAQILEMDNETLVKTWLKIDGSCLAAVYFDTQDKPWVVSKQGIKTPLLASPYADNLGKCLVYLDEAHTRGTDLKFPPHARAALTLGLGQTKDHTVQAAMRLRQLGTTQAVTFFIAPEINQSIRDLQRKKDGEEINSYDVICWLLDNTCEAIETLQPLYYSQGIDFCKRLQAAADLPDFIEDDEQRSKYVASIKQVERQTLQQLYGPSTKTKAAQRTTVFSSKIEGFIKELEARKMGFQDTGKAVHASALQEVEQERELEFEVESVRQVKKPIPYTPYNFPGLHRDIEIFARTGRLAAGSDSFIHCFQAMARTGLGRKYKINRNASSSSLFVSVEFERTVKLGVGTVNDNFLRPVQWILYSPCLETAIILTPEEAEVVLHVFREVERDGLAPKSHLVTYAAPTTRRMIHFSKLSYFAVPALPQDWEAPMWLSTEIGLFAGRLYFTFDEYSAVCEMLGVDEIATGTDEHSILEESTTETGESSNSESIKDPLDGAGDSADMVARTSEGASLNRLTPKPYTFTREWLAIRRRGQDFVQTPMGFIVHGKPLHSDHPFFRKPDVLPQASALLPLGLSELDGEHEDDIVDGVDMGDFDMSAEVGADEKLTDIQYHEDERYKSDDEEAGSESDNVAPNGNASKGEAPAGRHTRGIAARG